ncbi:MAG: hypothetical protein ACI9SP_001474 [Arenicella sp.]
MSTFPLLFRPLFRLLFRFSDRKLKAHIADIDSKLTGQIHGVDNLLEERMNQALFGITQLENKIYNDALDLITCGPEVAGLSVQKYLADMLNLLGASKPRVTIFGFGFFEVKLDPVDISAPIESYDKAKKLMQLRLDGLAESDDAREIINIYGEMPRVARLTACHYSEDNLLQLRLTRDQYEFKRKHRAWTQLIT